MSFAISLSHAFVSDMTGFAIGIYLVYLGIITPDAFFVFVFVLKKKGLSSATTLSSMVGYATVFAAPAITTVLRASPAANSLLKLVYSNNPQDPNKGVKSEIIGSVSVKEVSFSYPTRPKVRVANGLGFSCANGQCIALVGASGCGKSTVIQLLERFYPYSNGEISVDDTPIEDFSLEHLRSSMALVGQEPVLFRGSIIENVLLGVDGATIEDVREACRKANAATFVEAFPSGYETEIGERGGGLSGGQKQRIAIARALIRNPKILLLDEATAALDTESEKLVEEALRVASTGRTTVTIAHRLFTVQNADRIFVIEDGRVVEEGTHEELLGKRGRYYSMAMVQHIDH